MNCILCKLYLNIAVFFLKSQHIHAFESLNKPEKILKYLEIKVTSEKNKNFSAMSKAFYWLPSLFFSAKSLLKI